MTKNIEIKDQSHKITIKLTGEITVQHITDIYNRFKSSVDFTKDVEVEVSKINQIDLSFVQLIKSLEKTAKRSNKKITLSGSFEPAQLQLLKNSGLEPGISCNKKD